jgi:hypothetical protein
MWLQKCSTYEIGIKGGKTEKWLLTNCIVNTKYTEISVEQHKTLVPKRQMGKLSKEVLSMYKKQELQTSNDGLLFGIHTM